MEQKKKIICLSCSPSKGRNSDSMLDAFIHGMREVEGVEIEKVYLNDIYIEHWSVDNDSAPQKHEKDFKRLVDTIQCSSGLVIATPTYNFSVPAQLKNLLDRMRFFALDFERRTWLGQPKGMLTYLKPYFLVSGGTPTWAQKIFFFGYPPFWLRAVFLYHGTKYAKAFYCGDVRAYKNKKVLEKCRIKGNRYAHLLSCEKCRNIFSRIFIRPPQSG